MLLLCELAPLKMRLINSTTQKLEEFSGKIPEYAILSHTWGEKELYFQDLQKGNAKHIAEFAKFQGCCEQAKRDNFGYV